MRKPMQGMNVYVKICDQWEKVTVTDERDDMLKIFWQTSFGEIHGEVCKDEVVAEEDFKEIMEQKKKERILFDVGRRSGCYVPSQPTLVSVGENLFARSPIADIKGEPVEMRLENGGFQIGTMDWKRSIEETISEMESAKINGRVIMKGWEPMYMTCECRKQTAKELLKKLGVERVVVNQEATIVILKSGQKGIAKRNPSDDWDPEIGFWMAYGYAVSAKELGVQKKVTKGMVQKIMRKANVK